VKTPVRIGTAHEQVFQVGAQHLIDFADAELPGVLSTPNLVGFLEQTAREALQPFLEPGERSLGTELELRHLAPTPAGHRVTCIARVVQSEGTKITLQVEARDEREMIARGLHRRQVVIAARFAKAVAAKKL
jgi:fluoroacetyl-CoA thioesterase